MFTIESRSNNHKFPLNKSTLTELSNHTHESFLLTLILLVTLINSESERAGFIEVDGLLKPEKNLKNTMGW